MTDMVIVDHIDVPKTISFSYAEEQYRNTETASALHWNMNRNCFDLLLYLSITDCPLTVFRFPSFPWSPPVPPAQDYVFSSHHTSVGGQGGRLLQEVCQESQAEASAELVSVQISGQAHRAGAAAIAQRYARWLCVHTHTGQSVCRRALNCFKFGLVW